MFRFFCTSKSTELLKKCNPKIKKNIFSENLQVGFFRLWWIELIAGCWFQRLREEEKRQQEEFDRQRVAQVTIEVIVHAVFIIYITTICLLYTSDAADE